MLNIVHIKLNILIQKCSAEYYLYKIKCIDTITEYYPYKIKYTGASALLALSMWNSFYWHQCSAERYPYKIKYPDANSEHYQYKIKFTDTSAVLNIMHVKLNILMQVQCWTWAV